MALGVDGILVGCWTHPEGHTGCTVVLAPDGMLGAAAVRGGAPGTREIALLGPTSPQRECHAVVLSGGSAFGLSTADGVVEYCETHGIGYDKRVARIPIVAGAILFDLRRPGQPRPDRRAGRAACEAAGAADPPMGRVGAGAGCTVGKTAGLEHHAPGGQGWAVARGAGVTVGAIVAVNALGDVLDEHGAILAGSAAPPEQPRYPFVDPFPTPPVVGGGAAAPPPVPAAAAARHGPPGAAAPRPGPGGGGDPGLGEHTVIGCLVTDAALSKPDACRAVDLAHTGIARAVDPAHTSYDGDVLFLLAAGRVAASTDLVAQLGAEAVAAAIRAAVRAA
jgi:L-aminopeptidase/D-esterase-like protein